MEYSAWRRRVWVPATARAGMPKLRFHDLRHVAATAMVAEGVDVKTAQTRLGHSDPRLTLALYAQATTEADTAAATRIGDRLMPRAARDERAMEMSSDKRCPRPKRRDLPFYLSGRRDSNPRPQRPERCALTKLRYFPWPSDAT